MTTNSLSPNQLQVLQQHLKKTERVVFGKSLILPILFFLISLVPTKYLAFLQIFSRRGRGAVLGDSSLFQDIGMANMLLILGGMYLLGLVVMAYTYKYLALRKDVKNKKVKILNAKVKELKITKDFGTSYYDLHFFNRVEGINKIRFFEPHPYFPILQRGQNVTLMVSESALYPLEVFPGGIGE